MCSVAHTIIALFLPGTAVRVPRSGTKRALQRAKRTGDASLWGISAPKAARPPWWSSGCWLPLPSRRARRSRAPFHRKEEREREAGTQGRRPVCGGPEARARGDWREAGGEAADAVAESPITRAAGWGAGAARKMK
jgi:hypothetical protein